MHGPLNVKNEFIFTHFVMLIRCILLHLIFLKTNKIHKLKYNKIDKKKHNSYQVPTPTRFGTKVPSSLRTFVAENPSYNGT